MALKLRRKTINSFLISIITKFEKFYYLKNNSVENSEEEKSEIISPNLEELVAGELEQRNYFRTAAIDGATEELC